MQLRTRAALVALATSLVVAGMAAVGATAATAATGKLTITPTGYSDQYYVIVAGDFSGYHASGVDVDLLVEDHRRRRNAQPDGA